MFASTKGTDESYVVPLVDRYAVFHTEGPPDPVHQSGMPDVVEVERLSTSAFSCRTLVESIEQVAVQGRIIFGSTATQFFIVDVRLADPAVELIDQRQAWDDKLDQLGVSNRALADPDALFASLPERVSQPWHFRTMQGLFGWSDGIWSGVVWLIGLVVAMLTGIRWPRRSFPYAAAVVNGLAVDFIGEIVIGGGGPSAFAGLMCFPLYFLVATLIGQRIGRAALWLRQRHKAPTLQTP